MISSPTYQSDARGFWLVIDRNILTILDIRYIINKKLHILYNALSHSMDDNFKFWRGTPRGEAGTRLQANELFVHIRNIILHQISAKFSVFFRSIAEEKVSALPKRKLRGKR